MGSIMPWEDVLVPPANTGMIAQPVQVHMSAYPAPKVDSFLKGGPRMSGGLGSSPASEGRRDTHAGVPRPSAYSNCLAFPVDALCLVAGRQVQLMKRGK